MMSQNPLFVCSVNTIADLHPIHASLPSVVRTGTKFLFGAPTVVRLVFVNFKWTLGSSVPSVCAKKSVVMAISRSVSDEGPGRACDDDEAPIRSIDDDSWGLDDVFIPLIVGDDLRVVDDEAPTRSIDELGLIVDDDEAPTRSIVDVRLVDNGLTST